MTSIGNDVMTVMMMMMMMTVLVAVLHIIIDMTTVER